MPLPHPILPVHQQQWLSVQNTLVAINYLKRILAAPARYAACTILVSRMGIPMWDGKTSIKSVPIEFLFNSGMFQMRKGALLAFLTFAIR